MTLQDDIDALDALIQEKEVLIKAQQLAHRQAERKNERKAEKARQEAEEAEREAELQREFTHAQEGWETLKEQLDGGVPSFTGSDCQDYCYQDGRWCGCPLRTRWYQDRVEEIITLANKFDLTPEIATWIMDLNPNEFIGDNDYSELDPSVVYTALLCSISRPIAEMKQEVWERGNEMGLFDLADADFRINVLNFCHDSEVVTAVLREDLSSGTFQSREADEQDEILLQAILCIDQKTKELLDTLIHAAKQADTNSLNLCAGGDIVNGQGWDEVDPAKTRKLVELLVA